MVEFGKIKIKLNIEVIHDEIWLNCDIIINYIKLFQINLANNMNGLITCTKTTNFTRFPKSIQE